MDDLHKMHDDLEKVIEKDDTSSTVTGSDCEESFRHGPLTLREKLDAFVHSNRFQVGVVVLVIFDVCLVIAELLFDLEVVNLGEEHEESVPKVLHYCSIAILSVFLLEIALRIFVMRLEFFKHKLELFDAFIVIISFILDIVFRDRQDAASGVALLIILRLWRVGRIFNGIIISIRRQASKKVEKEKHLREACEQELNKFRAYCTSLEGEIDYLHRLLKEHNIPYTEKVQKRPEGHQISVQVEVNHKMGVEVVGEAVEGASEQVMGVKALNDGGRTAMNGSADLTGSEGRSSRRPGESKDMSDIITLESSTVAIS